MKISIFRPLVQSFYFNKIYVEAAKFWRGKAFLYLLLLVFLVKIPVLTTLHIEFKKLSKTAGEDVIKQVPEINIENGEVKTPEDRPYFIKVENEIIMVIDTSGKYNSLDESGAPILLTKHSLVYEKKRGFSKETRIHDLSQVSSFNMTQDDLRNWVKAFGNWFAAILAPFWIIGSFIWRVLLVLFCAAAGLAIASALKIELKYSNLLTLSIIASTPALIIDMIFTVLGFETYFPFILLLVINIGFLYFGIRACAKSGELFE